MIREIVRLRLRGPVGIYFALGQSVFVAAMTWQVDFSDMPWLGALIALPLLLPVGGLNGRRSVAFESGLPIAGRDVVLGNALAALAFSWLPLAAWLLVSIARGKPASVLFTIGEVAAVLTVATLIPHVVRGGEIRRPPGAAIGIAFAALAAVAAPVIYFAPPAIGASLLVVVAALVAVTTIRAVPNALQVAASSPGAQQEQYTEDTEDRRSRRTATSHALPPRPPVLRDLRASSEREGQRTQWWRILAHGFTGSFVMWAGLMVLMGATNGWFLYIILGTTSLLDAARNRTRWLLAFPVSTRARMLATYGPVFVAIIGGQALGSSIGRFVPFMHEFVGKDAPRAGDRHFFPEHETEPALEYWERAASGKVPVISAPWGESVQPDTLAILGTTFYDPYTITRSSSPQFTHWQFSRVTAALYGRPVSESEYDDHRNSLTRATGRGWRLAARWVGVCATFLFVLLLIETSRSQALAGTRNRRRLAWFAGILPIVLLGGFDIYYQFARGVLVIAPLSRWVLLHTQLSSSATQLAAIGGAALVLVSLYALLERQFARTEIKGQDPRIARMLA